MSTLGSGNTFAQLNINVDNRQVNTAITSLNTFNSVAGQSQNSVNSLGSSVSALEVRFSSLVRVAAELVGTFSLIGGIKWAVELSADAERADAAITSLLGNGNQAKEMIQQIMDLSKQRPFGFLDLEKQAQFLLAIGVNGQKVVPTLQAISDATVALGGDQDKMSSLALSIGRILDEGTVQARELNSLARQGVPVWKMLAEAITGNPNSISVATEDVRKRMVPSDQAVDSIIAGMERMRPIADKISGALANQWDIFKNRVNIGLKEIGDQLVETFNLKGALGSAVAEVDKVTKSLISGLSGHGDLFKGILAGVVAFAALQVVIQACEISFSLLTASLLGNPFTALATVIAAAVAALVYFKDTQIEIGGQSTTVRDVIVVAFQDAKDGILEAMTDLYEYFKGLWQVFEYGFKAVAENIESYFRQAFSVVKTLFPNVAGILEGSGVALGALMEGAGNTASGVGALAVGTIRTQFNNVEMGMDGAMKVLAAQAAQRTRDRNASLHPATDESAFFDDPNKPGPIPKINLLQGQNEAAMAALQKMNDEATTQLALVNQTNEQRERGQKVLQYVEQLQKAGITDQQEVNDKTLQYEKILQQLQQAQILKKLADDMGQAFGDTFTDIVTGAKTAGQAIRDLAAEIEKMIIQTLVARPLANAISSAAMGAFGAIPGFGSLVNVGGNVTPSVIANSNAGRFVDITNEAEPAGFASANGNIFDRSGIVNTPTFFPMRNGATGLMGEAGPEAVVPLSRDASGRLGIKGGGAGHGPVNVSMNIYASNADSFRKSKRQIMSDIRSAIPRS